MGMSTATLLRRGHDEVVGPDDPAPRPTRRTFSAEFKRSILEEYDRLPEGEKGSLLRREGLYSSHIVEWRRARDAATLEALAPKGRRPRRSVERVELDKARRKVARLEAELKKTRLALEITGKAHALLDELLSESAESETRPKQ